MRIVCEIPEGDDGVRAIKVLLEVLGEAWALSFRKTPLPPLYESVVRYEREPNAGEYEDFKCPRRTYEDGFGDCDDLVIYRIAELRAKGERATVQVMRRMGTGRMHVRVKRANGKLEDPTLLVRQGT